MMKTQMLYLLLLVLALVTIYSVSVAAQCKCVKESFDEMKEGVINGLDNVTRYSIKGYGSRYMKVSQKDKAEPKMEVEAADAIRFE